MGRIFHSLNHHGRFKQNGQKHLNIDTIILHCSQMITTCVSILFEQLQLAGVICFLSQMWLQVSLIAASTNSKFTRLTSTMMWCWTCQVYTYYSPRIIAANHKTIQIYARKQLDALIFSKPFKKKQVIQKKHSNLLSETTFAAFPSGASKKTRASWMGSPTNW